ncbi:hypothetical protein TWF481_005034 [Arthrobotrys musiformis]|uniref:Uncharacterized protein n=1 Tax=Arthrobotrys musiformis TaxID=47236 RepID=A0AAV9WMD4_9PEZI
MSGLLESKPLADPPSQVTSQALPPSVFEYKSPRNYPRPNFKGSRPIVKLPSRPSPVVDANPSATDSGTHIPIAKPIPTPSGDKLPPATTLPPWKSINNGSRTTPAPLEFHDRPDLLSANLQYLRKTYDICESACNWIVAHRCLLKMVQILKRGRDSLTVASLDRAIRALDNKSGVADTLELLQLKLFASYVRLEEYEEAWEMLPNLAFYHQSHPALWKTTYGELLTAAGYLNGALKNSSEMSKILDEERESRQNLLYEAEASCRKAIDAAIDGGVEIYGRQAKYQLYAMMAVIKFEHMDTDQAVFWKTLLVADGVDIEKELSTFPLLTRWVEKYNQIQDVSFQATIVSQAKETEQDPSPGIKEGTEDSSGAFGQRPEILGAILELKQLVTRGLDEITTTLNQGLKDIKCEREELRELKEELMELQSDCQFEIDIFRDEIEEFREEFGDKLLEELQDGLDSSLPADLRIESVRIANGRIADMNREVKEKLDALEAELKGEKQVRETASLIEQLGLD